MKRIDPITHRMKRRDIRVHVTPPEINSNIFSYQLLDIAESDIRSAKILCKKREFPQAVFLFQQAVEKLAKAYGLTFGFVDINRLRRDVGHNPLNIIQKPTENMINSLEEIKKNSLATDLSTGLANINDVDFTEFSNTLIMHKYDIKKWISTYSKEFEDSKEYVDSIYKEIKKVFSDCHKESETIKTQPFDNEEWTKNIQQYRLGIHSIIIKTCEKYNISKKQQKTILSQVDKEFGFKNINSHTMERVKAFLPHIYSIVTVGYALFYLSLLSAPHEQISRYPGEKEYFNPTEFYNLRNPIIKKLGTFLDYTDKTLKLFKESSSDYLNLQNIT